MFKIILTTILFFAECHAMIGEEFARTVCQNAVNGLLAQRLGEITNEKEKKLSDKYINLYCGGLQENARKTALKATESHEREIILGAAEYVARANYSAALKTVFQTEQLEEAIRLFRLLSVDKPETSADRDGILRLLHTSEELLEKRRYPMPEMHPIDLSGGFLITVGGDI
jgi:hypothetical protein